MNRVIIIGNLGRDPEVRYTSGGTAVANFSVATSRKWTDKQTNDRKEETEWHEVEVWGKLGETCAEYLTKGRKVMVEGRLKTDKWEDKQSGQKKQRTKIVGENVEFLTPKGDSGGGESTGGGAAAGGVPDDIPF